MKKRFFTIIIAAGLLCSLGACKSKMPESESALQVGTEETGESTAQTEGSVKSAGESSADATEAADTTEEPEEFKDAPDIIVPSEGEEIESMEAQESAVIDVEGGGGSL